MKKWYLWLIIPLVIAIIGGAGYLGAQSGQVEASDTPQAPTTVAVTRGDVQQTVTAPGQLVGTREVLLGFEASGQVAEINVRPGDLVKAGQALAQLNLRPLEEKLETAQLELAQAETEHTRNLRQAQLDLQIAEAELSQEKMKLSSLAAA